MTDFDLRRSAEGHCTKSLRVLFGAISAVAGISKAGKNVGVFVEALIDRCRPYRHVRMGASHSFKTLRGTKEAHESYLVAAMLLQTIDRRHRCVTRRENRGNDDDEPLG